MDSVEINHGDASEFYDFTESQMSLEIEWMPKNQRCGELRKKAQVVWLFIKNAKNNIYIATGKKAKERKISVVMDGTKISEKHENSTSGRRGIAGDDVWKRGNIDTL